MLQITWARSPASPVALSLFTGYLNCQGWRGNISDPPGDIDFSIITFTG